MTSRDHIGIGCLMLGLLAAPAAGQDPAQAADGAAWLPLRCDAFRTVGLHDMPGGAENYESVVFFENTFTLRENRMFMSHLLGTDGETTLYVTLEKAGEATEFECRPVRGTSDSEGFSCINNPPSEMLLVNPNTGRFTRSSIGGWTFYGAHQRSNGASLFVEYGDCGRPAAETTGR